MPEPGTLWSAVGALAAVLGLWWAISSGRRQDSPVTIFVSDPLGVPSTNVVLAFPDGLSLEPDQDGLFKVPASRAGQEACLRNQASRVALRWMVVPEAEGAIHRITL